MVTKDYSKSRMRENCTYGSVRGGQSNLIPSTRLKGFRGWRWRLTPQIIKKGGRLAQPDRGYICRRQIIQQTVYQAIRHRKPIP